MLLCNVIFELVFMEFGIFLLVWFLILVLKILVLLKLEEKD